MEVTDEEGTDGKDLGTVSCKHAGFGDIFQGGGTGGSFLWVRDMGDEPMHGPGPGYFPLYGGSMYHRTSTIEAY